jgi:hypothetical protein
MSDVIAFGVITAARKMNVLVPADLSILGFDDLQFSSVITPPLTTIHQPIFEKGKLAAEMLVKKSMVWQFNIYYYQQNSKLGRQLHKCKEYTLARDF